MEHDTEKFKKKRMNEPVQSGFSFIYLFLVFAGIVFCIYFVSAIGPEGPDSIVFDSNETKATNDPLMINISGGYIATVNLTTTSQNRKWKAFVGQVIGTFTLDDASGSTIYDWNMASVSGQVYATRNGSTILWTQIACANVSLMERENYEMNHTSAYDNITRTFNQTDHDDFVVGIRSIAADKCPSLRTYINNVSQTNQDRFDEVVLYDGINETTGSLVYATMIEQNLQGFDAATYDFQMIVPENGAATSNTVTAYYIYVEIR